MNLNVLSLASFINYLLTNSNIYTWLSQSTLVPMDIFIQFSHHHFVKTINGTF